MPKIKKTSSPLSLSFELSSDENQNQNQNQNQNLTDEEVTEKVFASLKNSTTPK